MTPTIHLLSAGAAQGLVKALQPRLEADSGTVLQARFGAVGAMREALLAGEPCDLMIVTAAMVDALVRDGLLRGDSRASLGRVHTGIAVRHGEPRPDVASAAGLKAALLDAGAIYLPDPQRATAGIHFADVLTRLGIHDRLALGFRSYPNGATAMREMAASHTARAIGCTQVTEINYTEGVDLVGVLPAPYELATEYSAAVCARSARPELAAQWIALLAGADTLALRAAGGFQA